MDTRAVVYKALFGSRYRVCKDCFDSLSDRRSDERCIGAGKTACELLHSQSRVGVVGSQLFRAAGNTETAFFKPYFYCLYNSLAIIYQRGRMSGLVGFPFIWVSRPSAYLDGFSLIWGFG